MEDTWLILSFKYCEHINSGELKSLGHRYLKRGASKEGTFIPMELLG